MAWLSSILIIIAFAFILWGLRLFKIYIIINGFLFGVLFGIILGIIGKASSTGSIIIGLFCGVIFAIIAWPLHKLIVYITTGLFTGAIKYYFKGGN